TGNHTQVDNIFCTEELMDVVIKCNTNDAKQPIKTDHYPIITQIDIHTPKTAWKPTGQNNLTNFPPPTEIETVQEFEDKLKALNETIQGAIEKHVELTTPSPYSKRWWSKDLAN
ncbi:hypothetical protein L208DRAFT_1257475, partial [Tricholoma matsutake]